MTTEPTAADVRAVAVARLRRAASLPRMKDGRRPPMRDDAVVSEGDKTSASGEVVSENRPALSSEAPSDAEGSPPFASSSTKADDSTAVTEDEPPPSSGRETPSKRRRGRSRSRSRSRSRGSKDFKEAKAELFRPDSSPDEVPPIPFFQSPIAAPVPSHHLAQSSLLQSPLLPPNLFVPSPLPFLNPASPPPPTLDAIREGLMRSNSARQLAMHKLTGGRDSPAAPTPSVTPPPFRTLGRSNTVTGVERSAARNIMLRRLEKRGAPKDGAESEVTSGGEEAGDIPPFRLRSATNAVEEIKRASPALSNVIDDRDLPSGPYDSPPNAPPTFVGNSRPSMTPAERKHAETLAKLTGDDPFEFDSPFRRVQPVPYAPQHGVVIEEDDTDQLDPPPPMSRLANGISTPPSNDDSASSQHLRVNKVSESSFSSLAGTDLERVPMFLQQEGQKSPYAQDTFPVTISPVGTPSRDKEPLDEETTDNDDVVYFQGGGGGGELRDRKALLNRLESSSEAKLSWVGADTGINLNSVLARRPDPRPVSTDADVSLERESNDDDQDANDVFDADPSEPSLPVSAPVDIVESSPKVESHLRPSLDTLPPRDGYPSSVIPETPSSIDAFEPQSASEKPSEDDRHPSSIARVSTSSSSSLVVVNNKSRPAFVSAERGTSGFYSEWDDAQTDAAQTDREGGLTDYEGKPERSPSRTRKKRGSDSMASSTWEKLKHFGGRRSRSNSFVRPSRKDAPTPSPHRESGASAKSDQSGHAVAFPSQTGSATQQLHSSSTSLLSLTGNTVPPPRDVPSPFPQLSAVDMAKYKDPKLMPLPGLKRLEEERRRVRKNSLSATSDVPGTVPNTRVNTPEPGLAHQASDSKLLSRYQHAGGEFLRSGDDTEPEDSVPRMNRYFDIVPPVPRSPTPNANPPTRAALPQTKEAALKWIRNRGRDPKSSDNLGAVSDSNTIRPGASGKRKMGLDNFLASARANDSGTERDSAATPRPGGKRRTAEQARQLAGSPESSFGYSISSSSSRSEKPMSSEYGVSSGQFSSERPSLDESVDRSRANGHVSAASMSSFSNASETLSPTIDQFPDTPPLKIPHRSPQSPTFVSPPSMNKPSSPEALAPVALMDQFNAVFASHPPTLESLRLGHMPRRFIRASVVRHVVSPNEVKNRLLLLFSDILVIAKFHDDDFQAPPLDRRLVVRNVISLHTTKLQKRQTRSHNEYMKLPSVQSFVNEFTSDPDAAITRCAQRTRLSLDASTLANFLFKTSGLDAAALTGYLARRSNKAVLKAFLDRFGFKGIRIDTALRLFLILIQLPPGDTHLSEHLLASFAGRWFEANKGVVSFDRDLTVRLVLTMMQLNEIMHGTADFPARNGGPMISSRDFIHDFRLMDPHMLVTDDLLQRVFNSIRNDRLIHGLPVREREPNTVDITSPLPSLVARVASDSVTIRIPHPDPAFRIHLHGQDLFFDPPSLDFSRSNEASFVIIASTLGRKEMLLVRTGMNAANYAALPSSCSLTVERQYMSNSFAITFPATSTYYPGPPSARCRTYRFSVLDDSEHDVLVDDMERLTSSRLISNGADPSVMERTTDAAAFQALRDTLIDSGEEGEDETVQPGTFLAALKGRKQRPQPMRGSELVTTCEQNSLVPAVLTYLQSTRALSNGNSTSVPPSASSTTPPSPAVL